MRVRPVSWASRRPLVRTTVPIAPPASAPQTLVIRSSPLPPRSLPLHHEREMGQSLREVAEKLAALDVDLFGIQADVVGQRSQLVHQLGRLVEAAGAGEHVGEPEGAGEKHALLRRPSLSVEPVQQWASTELPADGLDRALHPLAVALLEAEDAEREQIGVRFAEVRRSDECLPLAVPAAFVDEAPDGGGLAAPVVRPWGIVPASASWAAESSATHASAFECVKWCVCSR